MRTDRHEELVEASRSALNSAMAILEFIDDRMYTECPPGLEPHRAGGHLRHVLDFYQCFLDGLDSGVIDYDARGRSREIETSRDAAMRKIRFVLDEMKRRALSPGKPVCVRMEGLPGERRVLMRSTVGRELQVLSSHAVHHFALIAITLRGFGFPVHPDFGMAPSTLRHRAAQAA